MPSLIARPDFHDPVRHHSSGWRQGVFAPSRGFFATFGTWIARSRARKQLLELADQGDRHLLRDIGLTREEALRRGAKWFWQS